MVSCKHLYAKKSISNARVQKRKHISTDMLPPVVRRGSCMSQNPAFIISYPTVNALSISSQNLTVFAHQTIDRAHNPAFPGKILRASVPLLQNQDNS